jgi:hypothetical protein
MFRSPFMRRLPALLPALVAAPVAAQTARPKLEVLIVIDQMRPDY